MRAFRWSALLAIAAVACSDPEAPGHESDTAVSPALDAGAGLNAARASLLAADRAASAAAVSRGVTAGILASMTQDAYFLFPGEAIVKGKTAARAILAVNFDAKSKMPWKPLFADVSADARTGYTFGTLEITQDGGHVAFGKYITSWKKAGSGEWKIEALDLVFYLHDVTQSQVFPRPAHVELGPPVSETVVERTLLRTDARFAKAAGEIGEAEAFRKFADENATTMGNPDFLVGRHVIFKAHQGGDPADKLTWTPAFAGTGPAGDLGFTVGNAVFTVGATGQTFHSKYLTIWHRLPSGAWKYVQDGGSSAP